MSGIDDLMAESNERWASARRRSQGTEDNGLAVTTFSVALSLSAGGAVAAASDQGIRDSFTQLNHLITSFVAGSAGAPAG